MNKFELEQDQFVKSAHPVRQGCGGGQRLLLLQHTGRKSGNARLTVLEVVARDQATGTYIVASGFGEKADWFQILMEGEPGSRFNR
jgi:deazaflavin-dependent oxidoreductase (nitroreductase family)